MYPAIILAAAVAAAKSSAPSVPGAVRPALAIVFHLRPPLSDDPALAAADVALRAPEELGVPLQALRAHPNARLAFAVTPAYLMALESASSNQSALATAASDSSTLSAGQNRRLLAVLARHRPLDATLSRTAAGAHYLTLATAAANQHNGDRSVPFTARDIAEFAGDDAQVIVAQSGYGAAAKTTESSVAAVAALAQTDKAVTDELASAVRGGTVELIAVPDGEPVLPLLVDAGGKSTADPRVVAVHARADAQWLVDEAVRKVSAFARRRSSGLFSPFGAYDDAAGAVVQAGGASYALFSDRVLRAAGGEGSEAGIEAARGAGLRAYSLTVDKGVTMPILFWNENASGDLETVVGSDAAMSERLAAIAQSVSAGAQPAIVVLRIDAQGPWSQRPDARNVLTKLVAVMASGRAGSPTTPGLFLHAHPPTAPAYGYPASAESGSFSLWMGSADQASLWNALASARKAAGGDGALTKPQVRMALLSAESGDWFSSVASPLPGAELADRLDAFRELIGAIYRAAGVQAPSVIAPVRLGSALPGPVAPSPPASPKATPNP